MKGVVIFYLGTLLFAGCCTTTEITRTIDVGVPVVRDTVLLSEVDTIWVGTVNNAVGDSIGSIAVQPKGRKAIVDIQPDSVFVYDTLKIKTKGDPYAVIVEQFNWWEQIVIGLGFGLIVGLLTWWKTKRVIK